MFYRGVFQTFKDSANYVYLTFQKPSLRAWDELHDELKV